MTTTMMTTTMTTTNNDGTDGHKPSVLFLVHVEDYFQGSFESDYLDRIDALCRSTQYDKIIFLASGRSPNGTIAQQLYPYWRWSGSKMVWPMPRIDVWSWGWSYREDPCGCYSVKRHTPGSCPWTIPTYHDITWIPYEITENYLQLRDCRIFIGGGCLNECLEDWGVVLDFMDIPYTVQSDLIYECWICKEG